MKMMGKSRNNAYHARTGSETKVTFRAYLFGEAAARSALIGTANRARANPKKGCERVVRHSVSGSVDRDVIDTEDNSSRTDRSL
jgi:hypothetical protein